jgi:putative membrane protein
MSPCEEGPMRSFVVSTVVTAIALAVTVLILPGLSISGDNQVVALLVFAVVFGVVNALIRPVVKLLSLPINVMTLGLFTFVINGFMLLLAAAISSNFGATLKIDTFPPDFSLGALWTAILAAVVLTVVRAIVDMLTPDRR